MGQRICPPSEKVDVLGDRVSRRKVRSSPRGRRVWCDSLASSRDAQQSRVAAEFLLHN